MKIKLKWRIILVIAAVVSTAGFTISATVYFNKPHEMRPEEIVQRARELAVGCKQAKNSGNWRQMEEIARKWSVLQPQQLEPWIQAADAAKHQGNLQRVAEYLGSAPENCPVEILYILGQLQMEELRQPKQAVDTFKRTLKRNPADVESHLRLMLYYVMTCQRPQAIAQARECISLGTATPPVFAYLLSARWLVFANGYETNRAWLEADPTCELYDIASTVHLFVNPNLKEMAKSHRQGVIVPTTEYLEDRLDEALKRYPQNSELLALKLYHLSQAGDTDGVAKILSAAQPNTAEDARFWHYKGWYHSAKEEWQAADSAYRRALELDPFDWLTRHELAAVLRRTQSVEAAKSMQTLAQLGKEQMQIIRDAPAFDEIGREHYVAMVEYIQACGENVTAQQLRSCLARTP